MSKPGYSQNDLPLVVAIVVNRNGGTLLLKCVKSLLSQVYPRLRVIVVDNASEDDSIDLIRKHFPEVKLIMNGINVGFARAVNLALMQEKADYYLLFNYDAYLDDEEWLHRLVREAQRYSGRVLLSTPIIYDDGRTVWALGGRLDVLTGLDWHLYQGDALSVTSLPQVLRVDFISGCCMLLPSYILENIGPLDDNFFLYYEDLDYCLRAARAGYPSYVVNCGLVYHRASSSWRGRPLFGYYHSTKSRFYFYLKNFPVPFLVTAFFTQFILLTFFEIFLFRRPSVYFSHKVWAFCHALRTFKGKLLFSNPRPSVLPVIRFSELVALAKVRICSRRYYW